MPSHRSLKPITSLPRGLRTRFAPSPTGYLHLGHVASAIFVWGLARKHGASVLLRMEDHDRQRSRKDYEASILEDLIWLGFQADLGVTDAALASPFRQSDHPERYEKALSLLDRRGLIYRCACSRKDILDRHPSGSEELCYDGYCRARDEGPNIRVRLDRKTEVFEDLGLGFIEQTPADQCGDLLAKDRDGFWTYNFAVTVDDIEEDINLIIRGQDILAATGRQLQMRGLLKAEGRPYFIHHPLIRDSADKKLSKRDRSTSIAQWRAQGYDARRLLGKAAFDVGLIDRERPLAATDIEELFR